MSLQSPCAVLKLSFRVLEAAKVGSEICPLGMHFLESPFLLRVMNSTREFRSHVRI